MWQKTKNLYHLCVAVLANIFYGFPSRKLKVIGVTGTDGKTTTTSLIYHILKESGYNVSMISSVGAVICGKNYDVGFHVTTPSSFAVQKFMQKTLRKSDSKKSFMVLETTSHALDQHRTFGIKFDIGVLTNITHEHLDYHKTYTNYVKTKSKLLLRSKTAIVNMDDESYKIVNSKLQKANRKQITYGMTKGADVNPIEFPFETKMIGKFNVYNSLAAIAVARELGIDDEKIRKAVLSFRPPAGREEIIYTNSFSVMIDFAHTPNAFEQILSAVKTETKGRIIHVFGSAGLRDKTKRPFMGEVSSKYADVIVLTAEDPRTENVEKIMSEIETGIKNHELGVNLFKISDREAAIIKAIKMAQKGDIVIMTGKSHEKSMNYGYGEGPWDEYKTALKALKEK